MLIFERVICITIDGRLNIGPTGHEIKYFRQTEPLLGLWRLEAAGLRAESRALSDSVTEPEAVVTVANP